MTYFSTQPYFSKSSSNDRVYNQMKQGTGEEKSRSMHKKSLAFDRSFEKSSHPSIRPLTSHQNTSNIPVPTAEQHFKQNYNSTRSIRDSVDKYLELETSTNSLMKQLVLKQLVGELLLSNPFFRKCESNLVESLVLMSKIHSYAAQQPIHKKESTICFVVYGRVKIYSPDYKCVLEAGDTYGEHQLFNMPNIELKAKAIEGSSVLHLPKKYYKLLREESIKHGLKGEVNQLETLLRLGLIKKKLKEYIKYNVRV